ncbi:MAG TPA: hypothetical protein VFG72_06220 [Marmoricola sp.]|nr:hypothetical protein [Marmoricola sp.]
MWLLRPLPLLVLVVTACLVVAGVVTWQHDDGDDPTAWPSPVVPVQGADREVVRALAVLSRWDEQRAAAYSSGDVAALRRLYVRGTAAGRNDVRMLRGYVSRGLEVRDLELQRSQVAVLTSTDLRLRVELRERLAGATIVAAGTEVSLPRDRPERRVVTLVRSRTRWRVTSVSPVTAERLSAEPRRAGR